MAGDADPEDQPAGGVTVRDCEDERVSDADELRDWLRQQLEADEAEADAILSPPPGHYDKGWQADRLREFAMRQLVEVEVKQRVLAEYEAVRSEVRSPVNAEHRMNARARQFALEGVVRLLAQPYAGRDGFPAEWRS